MRKIITVLIIVLAVSGPAFAQNMLELRKAELEWSIDDGMLSISIAAETKGWVALGLGAAKMDGAPIFMGYSKDGKAYFEEHLGRGHGHRKTAEQRPVEYEVSEADGITKLQFTIDSSEFIPAGRTELPVIAAWGSRDSFTSLHRYRESALIPLSTD